MDYIFIDKNKNNGYDYALGIYDGFSTPETTGKSFNCSTSVIQTIISKNITIIYLNVQKIEQLYLKIFFKNIFNELDKIDISVIKNKVVPNLKGVLKEIHKLVNKNVNEEFDTDEMNGEIIIYADNILYHISSIFRTQIINSYFYENYPTQSMYEVLGRPGAESFMKFILDFCKKTYDQPAYPIIIGNTENNEVKMIFGNKEEKVYHKEDFECHL